MIDAQLIFPTKVYRAKFEDAQELQKDIVPLLLDKEKKDTSPVRYSANGYTSYGSNTNVLDLPQLDKLKTFLTEIVTKCHNETMLNGTPVLESSWYSVMRKHTYHEEHHHLPSVWSGVYYVQADQTHPGLTFVNRKNWECVFLRGKIKKSIKNTYVKRPIFNQEHHMAFDAMDNFKK